MTVIGVDVGGSGVRVQLKDAGGVRSSRLVTVLPRDGGRIKVMELAEVISRCVLAAGFDESSDLPVSICVGMSGLPELLDDPAHLAATVSSRLGASRVVLANDAVTAHVGALGFREGTVVAAGTGVIALGTDHERRWRRADGWGPLLGDEGSGAWIGHKGLVAACRALDGREDGSQRLLELMLEHYGTSEALVSRAYTASDPATFFGLFAPSVAQAAHSGDETAKAIWEEAGQRIAAAALSASVDLVPRFSWTGRLFDAGEILLRPFTQAVLIGRPDAEFLRPEGASSYGALLLAQEQRMENRPESAELVKVFDMTDVR